MKVVVRCCEPSYSEDTLTESGIRVVVSGHHLERVHMNVCLGGGVHYIEWPVDSIKVLYPPSLTNRIFPLMMGLPLPLR